MVTTVYCDDAGFTGDNLLNIEQPFFAYSAVAVEPAAAAALIHEMRTAFGINSNELKGSKLYDRGFAKELIERLAEVLKGRISIALNHKLYSLTAKFFEYVYEPNLSENSKFFYDRGTHIYVATALWAFLSMGDEAAGRIAERFESIMRRRKGDAPTYFDEDFKSGVDEAIEPIVRFAHARRAEAMDELGSLADDEGRIRWVLDLSSSSARSVLSTIGERFGEIDVTMDSSKPLEEFSEFLSAFVGQSETIYMQIGDKRGPLNFNLHRPPRFANSATEPGLQIADIFASFAAAAARDRHTPKGRAILEILLPLLDADTIYPDVAAIDLRRKDVMMNMALVAELASRAEENRDLLEDIEDYFETESFYYDLAPPDFGEPKKIRQ